MNVPEPEAAELIATVPVADSGGHMVGLDTAYAIVEALHDAHLEVFDVSDNRHEIEFRDDGWAIAHPIRERLDGSLFDCSARWPAWDPGIRGRRELAYSDTFGCWAVVERVSKKEQP